MSIPLDYIINDNRTPKELELKSFSGFSTKEIYKTLKQNIINNQIEEACHWTIELILSLQTSKVYDLFLSIITKNINICNPKIPTKLFNRYTTYITSKLSNNEARNSQVIRNHLMELCVIITNSKKTKSLSLAKIKDEEFSIDTILSKTMAPSNNIDMYFKIYDPEEIKVILNEYLHNLTTKNYEGLVYWLSWLINYEKNLLKKKQKLLCSRRYNSGIDEKFHNDIVWFIWEIIVLESNKLLSDKCQTQILELFKLYKLLYKNSNKYKYIYIILFSLKYFCTIFNIDQPVCADNFLCIQACSKVNLIFKEKKQYEQYKSNLQFDTNKPKTKADKKKHKLNLSLNKFDQLSKLDGQLT